MNQTLYNKSFHISLNSGLFKKLIRKNKQELTLWEEINMLVEKYRFNLMVIWKKFFIANRLCY